MKLLDKIGAAIKDFPAYIVYLWDKLPKVIKVSIYIAAAAELAVLAGDLKELDLGAIPTRYQIPLINLALVIVGEVIAWLKEQSASRPR